VSGSIEDGSGSCADERCELFAIGTFEIDATV